MQARLLQKDEVSAWVNANGKALHADARVPPPQTTQVHPHPRLCSHCSGCRESLDKEGACSSVTQHPEYPVAAPEAAFSPQKPNFILRSRGGDETWQGQAQVLALCNFWGLEQGL